MSGIGVHDVKVTKNQKVLNKEKIVIIVKQISLFIISYS